ncbi:MAG: hypothetical protein GPJ54_16550 [Candidatus Heimdallarchaeota archaeon]|nr:hypothetical protein [Candidatus Heimdallarchaeota archaeon]
MRQSKDCISFLLPLVAKGVRGLGKHPPVISSTGRSTELLETYRNVIMTVLPCFQKQERWYSVHRLKMINQWLKITEKLTLLTPVG